MQPEHWIAITSVVVSAFVSVSVAVFTQVFQGRREDKRLADARDDRQSERWLVARREVYARYLAESDRVGRLASDVDARFPSVERLDPAARLSAVSTSLATAEEYLEGLQSLIPLLEEIQLISTGPAGKTAVKHAGVLAFWGQEQTRALHHQVADLVDAHEMDMEVPDSWRRPEPGRAIPAPRVRTTVFRSEMRKMHKEMVRAMRRDLGFSDGDPGGVTSEGRESSPARRRARG